MHLPENSISSWADLCHEFIGAFTGGHQEPGRPSDLQLLQQKEGETLRKFPGIVTADVLVQGLSRGAIATRKLKGVKRDKVHAVYTGSAPCGEGKSL